MPASIEARLRRALFYLMYAGVDARAPRTRSQDTLPGHALPGQTCKSVKNTDSIELRSGYEAKTT